MSAKPKDDDISQYRTVAEVSADLNLPALRRLITQGRVPFILMVGCSWMLPQKTVEFLRKYYAPDADENGGVKRLRGLQGKAKADKMRALAAKLDPECAARQKAWFKRYPRKAKLSSKRR